MPAARGPELGLTNRRPGSFYKVASDEWLHVQVTSLCLTMVQLLRQMNEEKLKLEQIAAVC
jgi:hypothetical protein